ncbi:MULTISPECIES: twin-arginine translocase TatA/TatE family subunit [unclassified Lentilitoribacter]|jgi:sec-independent protein translocase protein TatA|uniref:twin-arginine translocase TatA/TatE family subunit n=1 Tax=unclassified Lentilitoribacter TaxID=2647570 RepID=UPI0013A6C497
MGNIGPLQIVIILLVVLVFFGRGKIPQLMGDVAKGIKSFKSGMKEEVDTAESKTVEVEKQAEKDKV